jgi:hypothetical protein
MAEKIDPKYLEGLKFNFVEQRKAKKDGRDIVQNIPQQRALAQEDILDWKDYGDNVVIVTMDGQKITVSKKGNADPLAAMTVPDLKALLDEKKIEYPKDAKKADLIDLAKKATAS